MCAPVNRKAEIPTEPENSQKRSPTSGGCVVCACTSVDNVTQEEKAGELGASDGDGRRLAGVAGVQSPTAKPEQVHSRKNTAGRTTRMTPL